MQSQAVYLNERTLLEQIKAGDPAAKHWLYDQYAAAMYGFVLQLVPDQQEAANILLKTFTGIFENIDEYYQSGRISLFSWLLEKTREMAVRVCPYGELTGNESNALIQFSRTLDEQCKQVFVLCYCKGLSRSNAAITMGVSEERVHQLLKEAMIAFRKFSTGN
ncbi:sigma-70 family RNA polymerase sigma factor [Chitinophaga sp. XS-30]|nr:sigma-70 family RNA polymerase sigma factor [Chitinophaga sp. XS-30]